MLTVGAVLDEVDDEGADVDDEAGVDDEDELIGGAVEVVEPPVGWVLAEVLGTAGELDAGWFRNNTRSSTVTARTPSTVATAI